MVHSIQLLSHLNRLPLLSLLLLLLGGLPAQLQHSLGVMACTSLLVSRGATVDGSLLLARSDDGSDAISDTNNLVLHPAPSGPALWRSNMNDLTVRPLLLLPESLLLPGRGLPGKCL